MIQRRMIITLWLTGALCYSQEAGSVSFEVTSITLSTAANSNPRVSMVGGPGTLKPGQLVCTNVTVRMLTLRAYGLEPWQPDLVYGPPSLDKGSYDIEAKIPSGSTPDQLPLMLQTLLAERFGLVAHWEERALPIFELTVAKGGPKLKAPEQPAPSAARSVDPGHASNPPAVVRDADGWPVLPPGRPGIGVWTQPGSPLQHIAARMKTMADLVAAMDRWRVVDRPVVDRTGLTGTYDFAFSFMPAAVAMSPDPGTAQPSRLSTELGVGPDPAPDIFAILERQLGLRLASSKGPVNVLVVDKVNVKPTEN
jgi:uncharacterized protein (TIGR03435 family)